MDVVRVLLAGCPDALKITSMKDVDGDTPLHAACRCGAPIEVLVTLLQANPITALWRDYEGLNPLMRLWVRYYVLLGEHVISNVKNPSDLPSELLEAWQKSVLLLRTMSVMDERRGGEGSKYSALAHIAGSSNNSSQESQAPSTHNQHVIGFHQHRATPFRAVHAASAVDCPRCVVRIAMVLFPQELLSRDEHGYLPIHIAAATPAFAVHDLRGEGYSIDDAIYDDELRQRRARNYSGDQSNESLNSSKSKDSDSKYKEPSVIDILLGGAPSAASECDPHGQLPLHVAIMRGKTLDEGVRALVQAYPDALTMPDVNTNLYPFMLAASVGRGRGDCATIYELLRGAPELVKLGLKEQCESVVENHQAICQLKA